MAEDFDAMEVCCGTVVTSVEPEICDCLFSGFVFVVFHVVLMFCQFVLLDEAVHQCFSVLCCQMGPQILS
jgi:hypothetical protein